jgi:branched-chain amino acid transport system permease protein
MSPSQTNLAAAAFIYGMVIVSLLVLTGWAGQISLGQFAFAGIGGYVASAISAPFPIVVLLGALTGAVAAVVVGFPALKLRGLHLAVITMALALTVTAFLLNPRYLGKHLPDALDRPNFFGMDLDDQRVFYYLTLAVLALVVFAVVGLRRSRTARALIAARDNDQAAQSFGIGLVRLRLAAFAISGFIAALAGAMFAFHQHGVTATAFAPEVSVTMFVMAVIGGLGAVAGPLIGATFNGILLVVGASPLIALFASGIGGLLLLLFVPGGLSQLVFGIRDSVLRRVASRNRIVVPSLVADIAMTDTPRAAIASKRASGGGEAFVPVTYRLDGQWLTNPEKGDERRGTRRSARSEKEPARG